MSPGLFPDSVVRRFASRFWSRLSWLCDHGIVQDSDRLLQRSLVARRKCKVTKFITEQLDCGNDILGIFIDASKAFDSLSHQILLDKLYAFGFRDITYEWLKSYLNDRYQFVQIG